MLDSEVVVSRLLGSFALLVCLRCLCPLSSLLTFTTANCLASSHPSGGSNIHDVIPEPLKRELRLRLLSHLGTTFLWLRGLVRPRSFNGAN